MRLSRRHACDLLRSRPLTNPTATAVMALDATIQVALFTAPVVSRPQ